MGTPVIDRTGLSGLWNYTIAYSRPQPVAVAGGTEADAPYFDAAIRGQLGLKLQSERGPVDVLVIQTVAPPIEI